MSLFLHRDEPLILGRLVITFGGIMDHDLLLARLGVDGSLDGACGLVMDGTSTAEDATAEVLETDVVPSETDGTSLAVELTFDTADTEVLMLCPE